MRKIFKMFVLLIAFVSFTAAQDSLQVNTTEGTVEGSRAADGDYLTFYDIPYAGPTSGENRFKAPSPPTNYSGVYHAVNRNILCAQPNARGLIGVENCLTLSIYTKNTTTPKPVFVWLNAEQYASTTTPVFSYKKIVEENIVFVPLNFRLSIFGFICLGVPDAPGNAGLKDILQGLTWLKSNIAGFGGDPNNIVLIGHGSGAALVDLLTMSPRSKNLVHKAIALSGSALSPWAVAYEPVRYAEVFGGVLGITQKSREQLAKLLQTTNPNVLATALEEFKFTNNSLIFAPCIESKNSDPNETIITDAPLNILRSGNYNHVPYIAGFTTREGTLKASEVVFNRWLEGMEANFTNFLPVDLDTNGNATAVQDIKRFYFGDRTIDMGTIEDYLEYQGDTLILLAVIRTARERGVTSTSPVRLLEFGYRGTLNSDWPFNQIPLHGVKHGGFLNYLFDYDLRPSDVQAMNSLVRRLTRFAHTGEPANSAAANVVWSAVDKANLNYLYYGGNDGTGSVAYVEEARVNPHTTRMTFWNSTYERYYVPPRPVSGANSLLGVVLFVTLSQLFFLMF